MKQRSGGRMVHSPDILKLSESWIRILNKMDEVEKCPKDFGSGDLLHASEIHTLMAIGIHKDINGTNLAGLLGISRSAISQMISRLVRKDLVEKYRDPDNDKEIRLRLTPRGFIAYLGHEQFHAKIYAHLQQKLGPVTKEQFQFLTQFLNAVEETADEVLQDKR
jgi:DNA-binding MarR family transcriptional regulator